jgi:histone-lysine N-methyltransferase SETD2
MVFLLDCMYKTNKFDMPLLNMVGITSTYATFNVGFAFLHAENE